MFCQSVCAFLEYSLKHGTSSLLCLDFYFSFLKNQSFIISLHRRATFVSLFLYMNLLQQITGYCSLCDDLEARRGVLSFSFFLVCRFFTSFAFGFAHVGLTCTCAVDSLLACMPAHTCGAYTNRIHHEICLHSCN